MSEVKKSAEEEQELEMIESIKEEKDMKTRVRLVALNHHQKVKSDLDEIQEA